jgi:predicted lipid-binding transport protein (Tim44 family)
VAAPVPAREAELPAPVQPSAGARTLPDPNSPLGQSLMRIRAVDPAFEPGAFLQGAEGAFRMIVQAFAAGDRQTLRDLLSEDSFAGFDQAITARELAGETQRTELRAINDMAIEEAELRGTVADITVRIVSDQVNLITAKDGSISAGAEAVTEITDLWTFQRDTRAPDPTWRLVGTRSA